MVDPLFDDLMYIERVKFTEPYGLQLTGGDQSPLERFLANKLADELINQFRSTFIVRDKPIVIDDPNNGVIIIDDVIPELIDCCYAALGEVPINGIIMYQGSPAGLPEQWEVCDGSLDSLGNLLPDLRDKFIRGAGEEYGTSALDETGGSEFIDINHTHGTGSLAVSNYEHTHGAGTYAVSSEAHTHDSGTLTSDSDNHSHTSGTLDTDNDTHGHTSGTLDTDNDSHSHTADGTLAAASDAHTHDSGTLSTGSGSTEAEVGEDGVKHTVSLTGHTHSVTAGATASDAHTHDVTGSTDSDIHDHAVDSGSTANDTHDHAINAGSTGSDSHSHSITGGATASDSHNHTLSGASANDVHNHTLSGLTSDALSGSQSVLNPYYALFFIKRIF